MLGANTYNPNIFYTPDQETINSEDIAMKRTPRRSPFPCDLCDRKFDARPSLNQHLRHAPAHADCNECRSGLPDLPTIDAVQTHFRNVHLQGNLDVEATEDDAIRNELETVATDDAPSGAAAPVAQATATQGSSNVDNAVPSLGGRSWVAVAGTGIQPVQHRPAFPIAPPAVPASADPRYTDDRPPRYTGNRRPRYNEDWRLRYTGETSKAVSAVFGFCRKRLGENLTVEDVRARTGTYFSNEIVREILDGAMRRAPVDRSPEGTLLRKRAAAERADRAQAAENAFIHRLRKVDRGLLNESQQRMMRCFRGTPDARLSKPITIFDRVCTWVEYKDTFGFKGDPFVAGRNLEQFARYAQDGPGIVVYRHGFERNIFNINGVRYFREAEVLAWLDEQDPDVEESRQDPVVEESKQDPDVEESKQEEEEEKKEQEGAGNEGEQGSGEASNQQVALDVPEWTYRVVQAEEEVDYGCWPSQNKECIW